MLPVERDREITKGKIFILGVIRIQVFAMCSSVREYQRGTAMYIYKEDIVKRVRVGDSNKGWFWPLSLEQ